MDLQRIVGGVLVVAGAVVVFIFAAADVIGLGGGGSTFGWKQVVGVIVGVVVLTLGLLVMSVKQVPGRRKG